MRSSCQALHCFVHPPQSNFTAGAYSSFPGPLSVRVKNDTLFTPRPNSALYMQLFKRVAE